MSLAAPRHLPALPGDRYIENMSIPIHCRIYLAAIQSRQLLIKVTQQA